MHSSAPHYFSQLQLSFVLEMSSNASTTLHQLSGAEYPSLSIKIQLGRFLCSGSLAGAIAGTTCHLLLLYCWGHVGSQLWQEPENPQ